MIQLKVSIYQSEAQAWPTESQALAKVITMDCRDPYLSVFFRTVLIFLTLI